MLYSDQLSGTLISQNMIHSALNVSQIHHRYDIYVYLLQINFYHRDLPNMQNIHGRWWWRTPCCDNTASTLFDSFVSVKCGALQGCVLSPFLYTLYINDCIGLSPSTKYLKYPDGTAILALLKGNKSIMDYHTTVTHLTVRITTWILMPARQKSWQFPFTPAP